MDLYSWWGKGLSGNWYFNVLLNVLIGRRWGERGHSLSDGRLAPGNQIGRYLNLFFRGGFTESAIEGIPAGRIFAVAG